MLSLAILLAFVITPVLAGFIYRSQLYRKWCQRSCDACRLESQCRACEQLKENESRKIATDLRVPHTCGQAHPLVPHSCPFARFKYAIWFNRRKGTVVEFDQPIHKSPVPQLKVIKGEKRDERSIGRERERIRYERAARRDRILERDRTDVRSGGAQGLGSPAEGTPSREESTQAGEAGQGQQVFEGEEHRQAQGQTEDPARRVRILFVEE